MIDTEDAWIAIGTVGVLTTLFLLIPPKYDPMILLREWLEKRNER